MKTKINKIIVTKITTLLLSCCLVLALTGCSENTYQESISEETQINYDIGGYFIVEKEWEYNSNTQKIVYAQDTKVKYLIIRGNNRSGITPLYNADGTLQIHEEKEN